MVEFGCMVAQLARSLHFILPPTMSHKTPSRIGQAVFGIDLTALSPMALRNVPSFWLHILIKIPLSMHFPQRKRPKKGCQNGNLSHTF